MYFKKLCLITFLSLGLLHAQNNNVGLNVNDKDLEVSASVDLNTLVYYSSSTIFTLDASYLHADGDNLSTFGVNAKNTFQGFDGFAMGIGIKSVFADDFFAVPLSAKAIYTLPFYGIPTTSLSASIAYAPSVLSFRDAESYTELRTEANMEVVTNIHLFAGYRNIKTEYDRYDLTFDNGFYGGMKLSF